MTQEQGRLYAEKRREIASKLANATPDVTHVRITSRTPAVIFQLRIRLENLRRQILEHHASAGCLGCRMSHEKPQCFPFRIFVCRLNLPHLRHPPCVSGCNSGDAQHGTS